MTTMHKAVNLFITIPEGFKVLPQTQTIHGTEGILLAGHIEYPGDHTKTLQVELFVPCFGGNEEEIARILNR